MKTLASNRAPQTNTSLTELALIVVQIAYRAKVQRIPAQPVKQINIFRTRPVLMTVVLRVSIMRQIASTAMSLVPRAKEVQRHAFLAAAI